MRKEKYNCWRCSGTGGSGPIRKSRDWSDSRRLYFYGNESAPITARDTQKGKEIALVHPEVLARMSLAGVSPKDRQPSGFRERSAHE